MWDPDPVDAGPSRDRALAAARRRGMVQGVVAMSAAILLWWAWSPWAGAFAAAVGALALSLAFVSPGRGFVALERAVGRFAGWVGVAVTWILTVPVYYLVFLPLGLFLRATGRLRVTRRPDPELASYWRTPEPHEPGPDRYRRQF